MGSRAAGSVSRVIKTCLKTKKTMTASVLKELVLVER